MEEQEKSCAMICGEPEVIEQLMESLLGMADVADEQGMNNEADVLSGLIRDVKIMKAAQYEGFQNYWLANGRAFELAFKKKLEAQSEGEKSYQRAWTETLQDFMDSLLGSQKEFVGKNLKTAQYEGFQNYWLMNSRAFELAFKEKLEAQPDKDKSFFKAWMEVLDGYQDEKGRQKAMEKALKTASLEKSDMAKLVLSEADRRKVSIADLYCEWADCHREALSKMLSQASRKIEDGEHPAVAAYEALDYFVSGAHSRNTLRKIRSCADKVEQGLTKNAGFWEKIRDVFFGWKARIADAWDFVTFRSGAGSKIINKLTAMGNWFKNEHDKIYSQVASGGALDPAMVHHQLSPYLDQLRSLVHLIKSPGSAARIADMPELIVSGKPNPEFVNASTRGMGLREFEDYSHKLSEVLIQAEGAARQYDKALKEGVIGTAPEGGQDDTTLSNALGASTKLLAQNLTKYSSAIDFKEMVNKVSQPQWAQILEAATKRAQISQGYAPSAGSVTDAANDIVADYMGIVAPYFNALRSEVNASTLPPPQKGKTAKEIEVISKAHQEEIKKRVGELISEKFGLLEGEGE